MTHRSTKDAVEELFRRQAAGDSTALDELVAESMANHAAGPQGRQGMRRILLASPNPSSASRAPAGSPAQTPSRQSSSEPASSRGGPRRP